MSGATTIRFRDMQGSFLTSCVIQAFLLLLSSLIMDGGEIFTFFLIAIVAHWAMFIMIFTRRRDYLTPADVLFIKAGFLIILLAMPLLLWPLHALFLVLQR